MKESTPRKTEQKKKKVKKQEVHIRGGLFISPHFLPQLGSENFDRPGEKYLIPPIFHLPFSPTKHP